MVKVIVEWPNGLAVSDVVRFEKLVRKTGGNGVFVAPGSASANIAMRQLPTFEQFREWYFDKSMSHEASDYYHFFTGNWPQ